MQHLKTRIVRTSEDKMFSFRASTEMGQYNSSYKPYRNGWENDKQTTVTMDLIALTE